MNGAWSGVGRGGPSWCLDGYFSGWIDGAFSLVDLDRLVGQPVDFVERLHCCGLQGLIPRSIRYPLTASLVVVSGDTWKRQRQTMSPAFSPAKLKLVSQSSGFVPMCPQTDIPTNRCAYRPICPKTDVPTDRCAHSPISLNLTLHKLI